MNPFILANAAAVIMAEIDQAERLELGGVTTLTAEPSPVGPLSRQQRRALERKLAKTNTSEKGE